jgi:predicted nucleotidyltransferase
MGYLELIKEKELKKEHLRKTAMDEAYRLAELLRTKFSFEALYLIGSVLRKGYFSGHSDIDFVIKGLQEEHFLRAFSFLMTQSEFDVDFKRYEDMDEYGKKIVHEKGLLLREREDS